MDQLAPSFPADQMYLNGKMLVPHHGPGLKPKVSTGSYNGTPMAQNSRCYETHGLYNQSRPCGPRDDITIKERGYHQTMGLVPEFRREAEAYNVAASRYRQGIFGDSQ